MRTVRNANSTSPLSHFSYIAGHVNISASNSDHQELKMEKNTAIEWTSYRLETCSNSLLNDPLITGGPDVR
jgi:hypothetical protein